MKPLSFGSSLGPNIILTPNVGNITPNTATVTELVNGLYVEIDDYNAETLTLTSTGYCNNSITYNINKTLPIGPTPTPTLTPTATPTPTPTATGTPTPTPTGTCVYDEYISVYNYHWYDECPSAGQPCPSGDGTASCSNFVDSGYITSMQFPKSCVQGLTPSATVEINFDNSGSIGDLSDDGSGRDECTLGYVSGPTSVQVVDEGNYVRLRLPYIYKNANHGGPYGITGSVTFSFS